MSHTVGKLLIRATTLLGILSQLKVYTQSYGLPKSWESQLWEFRDSHSGVLGHNDIWVLVLRPGMEYIIRGKVVASPKSGSRWILWVRGCLWLVCTLKCSNYALTNLLFGLCRFMWVSELLVNLPSPIPELQHAPRSPKCYNPGNAPRLFFLPLNLWTRSWVHQRTWGCVTIPLGLV